MAVEALRDARTMVAGAALVKEEDKGVEKREVEARRGVKGAPGSGAGQFVNKRQITEIAGVGDAITRTLPRDKCEAVDIAGFKEINLRRISLPDNEKDVALLNRLH